jgi:hypothetical protein
MKTYSNIEQSHCIFPQWVTEKSSYFTFHLTVSISLSQQLHLHGKSNFWPKFIIQPSETQKTPN